MTAQNDTMLELDDIQAAALMPRPHPYAGSYVAVRIDDRRAGRELLRRLIPLLEPVSSFDPARPVSLGVGLSYAGLRGARRARAVAGHLPGRVPAGHGRARRLHRRRRARTRPSTGRRRWARRTCTWWWPRWPGHLPDADPGHARRARRPRPARRQRDLVAGRARAPGRTRAVRLQGRHQPAGGRGHRHPRQQPARGTAEGRRVRPGLRGRERRPASDPAAGRAGPQRHLRGLPQAAPERRRVPPVPARERRGPGRGGVARGQVRRALAQRRAARPGPGQGRPRAGRRPPAQQRLPLRRRPARAEVPGRRARAADERARRGHHRPGPAAPHDPARHQLRPRRCRPACWTTTAPTAV